MTSKGVSGTSGTLAQEVVSGYAEKHRGLLLPTPAARDWKGKTNPGVVKEGSGCIYGETLPDSVERMFGGLLQSPRANVVNGCDLNNPKIAYRGHGFLEEQISQMVVEGMLPTPAARDHKQDIVDEKLARRAETHQVVMPEVIANLAQYGMLPTPVTQDFKKRGPNSHQQGLGDMLYGMANGSKDSEVLKSQGVDAGQTSRLSPLFTEEMMGFPFLWTTLPFLKESGEPKA